MTERYIVVASSDYRKFLALVNEWMTKDYVPVGGISIRGQEYLQGMVLEAKLEPSNETSTRGRGRPKGSTTND